LIEFLIIALSVFIVIKFMNRLVRKREAEGA
jgi:large-conductance mechanosensitive channel